MAKKTGGYTLFMLCISL